ncbi:MAG: hypothetical protein HQK55_12850 [Deltaproteobacteria bacterium]|nr:hypothetical protein [Deltaproteobacteria bacterium]
MGEHPMAKLKLLPVGNGLEVERTLTPGEKRRLLDAADMLPQQDRRSQDYNRYRRPEWTKVAK